MTGDRSSKTSRFFRLLSSVFLPFSIQFISFDYAIAETDNALGKFGNFVFVGHHYDGAALRVQIRE